MGLENGIVIKADTLPEFAEEDGHVCYWRKSRGIRDAIIEALSTYMICPNDKREYYITAEDIPSIIKALKPFFNKDYWEENARSIWEFEDVFDILIKQVCNLQKTKEYLEENTDAKCYFYDSY